MKGTMKYVSAAVLGLGLLAGSAGLCHAQTSDTGGSGRNTTTNGRTADTTRTGDTRDDTRGFNLGWLGLLGLLGLVGLMPRSGDDRARQAGGTTMPPR